MNWEKVLSNHFEPDTEVPDWPERINALVRCQTARWPLLRQNIRRLEQALTRPIPQGEFEILAQCNPERRSSTTAKVDPASVQERPCKLCPENLFPEQRGLAYGQELIVLCNPFPILRHHVSIVHRSHTQQAIHERLPLLLSLAKDLGNAFFLFYNGPQCGASAPDHFHVQACARSGLPLFRHLNLLKTDHAMCKHYHLVRHESGIDIVTLHPYHARLLAYRGSDAGTLAEWIEHTIRALSEFTQTPAEPLLNLLAWYDAAYHDAGQWTICLFPRATHRPACYYDGTLIVSPASLDMAGLMVFPFQEHFASLTPEDVAQIYAEVSLAPTLFSRLLAHLTMR